MPDRWPARSSSMLEHAHACSHVPPAERLKEYKRAIDRSV
eukprot:CAMPEP_0119415330 /NCGR_PEP_ID=MMETSP1335-20130426/8716_1 /TAXON_ID=259385 /ORGANISM="Chrysoculter rhomboideus, Strain RCC1486" /LENGTH=39 /DNA_ID= /DNA_START= /DNA_END= /DNA_ORIENTATION=